MGYAWNVTAKGFRLTRPLEAKIQQKLVKLELHIRHFPADAVHLQIVLSRHPKRLMFTAALTLKLPSNPLHSEKTAADPIPAFDNAFKALLREVSSLKAELRGEKTHARKATIRRQPSGVLPSPAASPPLRPEPELIGRQIEAEQSRLQHYLTRQISRAQLDGTIPGNALEADDILDEVVRQIETGARKRPPGSPLRVWIYQLASAELQRQMERLQSDVRQQVSFDGRSAPGDSAEGPGGIRSEEPEGAVNQEFGSLDAQGGDRIMDASVLAPDQSATEHELLEYVQRSASQWPRSERTMFELHFLEGFELDEVAMLQGWDLKQAAALRDAVHLHLRHLLREATETVSRPRPHIMSALSPATRSRALSGKTSIRS